MGRPRAKPRSACLCCLRWTAFMVPRVPVGWISRRDDGKGVEARVVLGWIIWCPRHLEVGPGLAVGKAFFRAHGVFCLGPRGGYSDGGGVEGDGAKMFVGEVNLVVWQARSRCWSFGREKRTSSSMSTSLLCGFKAGLERLKKFPSGVPRGLGLRNLGQEWHGICSGTNKGLRCEMV